MQCAQDTTDDTDDMQNKTLILLNSLWKFTKVDDNAKKIQKGKWIILRGMEYE